MFIYGFKNLLEIIMQIYKYSFMFVVLLFGNSIIAAEKFDLHAAGKDLKHVIIPGYKDISKEKNKEIKLAGVH